MEVALRAAFASLDGKGLDWTGLGRLSDATHE